MPEASSAASAKPNEGAAPAPPCILVIFGASGDLTKRLLVPSLCHLRASKLLPERFAVVGVARTAMSDEEFRRSFDDIAGGESGGPAPEDWQFLRSRLHYLAGEWGDAATYTALDACLKKIGSAQGGIENVIFYLAIPASGFATVVSHLGKAGLVREGAGNWRRVVIEKPFGHDLPSAQALNRDITAVLAEQQIFRIDHYLGKETVQNIMVLRFANGLFEPIWSRHHIDHVQITVAETLGVERRGAFYDATGALRDMVPNHLFQLLTLTAMEPPTCFDAEAVRTEKAKVLQSVHIFRPEDARRNVVRGQYGAGSVAGEAIVPYRKAPSVAPGSTTETFVALKLMIDNWRWAGVPFYLRTGKALARRRSEVVIQFRQAPLAIFRDTPVDRLTPNDMILGIQPDEGVTLRFGAKVPGPHVDIRGVEMKFAYKDHFATAPSTGYETLLYDAMVGDAMLFQRADNIELGWRVVQPVLDVWADRNAPPPVIYPAGSGGPLEADELLQRDGRHWRPLTANGVS